MANTWIMKKLWSKIHVSPLTYIVIFLSLLAGYIKYISIIVGILFIHELGHIFMCLIFKKRIESISIYPFGSIIKLDDYISSSIYRELLISIGGITMQLLLGIFIKDETIIFYNKIIMLFNLMPICPLDGYNILKCLLSLVVPLKKVLYILVIASIITLVSIIVRYELIKENTLIIIFLIYKIIEEYKNIKYLLNKFYLERILYAFKYKVKYISSINGMFRNNKHIINGINEHDYLIKYKYSRK